MEKRHRSGRAHSVATGSVRRPEKGVAGNESVKGAVIGPDFERAPTGMLHRPPPPSSLGKAGRSKALSSRGPGRACCPPWAPGDGAKDHCTFAYVPRRPPGFIPRSEPVSWTSETLAD